MEWYNQLVETLYKFFDNELVEILTVILSTLGAFLIAFSKTSFGKKQFKNLKELLSVSNRKLQESADVLNKSKEQHLEEIKELKENYENKLAIAYDKVNTLENLVISIAENSQNIKVKDAVKKYKETKKNEIDQISDVLAKVKETYEERLEKVEEALKHGKNND